MGSVFGKQRVSKLYTVLKCNQGICACLAEQCRNLGPLPAGLSICLDQLAVRYRGRTRTVNI
jgi:hypothetical protein